MIEHEVNNIIFKSKIIYCSDSVFDVKGCRTVFFKCIKNELDIPSFNCFEEINYIIDLSQSIDDLWKNMNRQTRRNIKKAIDNGIIVKKNQNYDDFYNMYIDHMISKKHIKFYERINKENIKKYGTLFTAEHNGEIISGSAFLEDENNIVYWVTASYRYSNNKETRDLSGNATHLIQWEVMKYAKAKGIKEYNLGPCGSYGVSHDSLIRFKEGLGSKKITYYNYYKDYNIFLKTVRGIYKRYKTNRAHNEIERSSSE